MMKCIPIILVVLSVACSSAIPEINLKSDGSIFSNKMIISEDELKRNYTQSEVVIVVDNDVPYEELIELPELLESNGVQKVGIKSPISNKE